MRWIVRFLVTLFVLAAVAIGALLLVPGDRIAALAEREFVAATGRSIDIDDDVTATIFPRLGVRTGPVEIANADWADSGPMLRAEGLQVGVELLPLIAGRIEIAEITIIAPEVLLERGADGRANWEFETAAAREAIGESAGAGGGIPEFTLGQANITGGSLRYRDHASGGDVTLTDLDLRLELPVFDGPGDITMTARMNDQLQEISGRVENFGPFLNGAVSRMALTLGVGGSTIGFEGRGGYQPFAFDGTINADLADMAAVHATLGQAAPDVPQGFGRQIGVVGEVTFTPEQTMHLRGATLRLDQNRLAGEADVELDRERPYISAQFTADHLDFSSLAAGGGEAPETTTEGTVAQGWSRDPIDAAFLALADADIAFRAESMDLGTLKLGPTRATAALDRSRIVFDLREVLAYEGAVTGQFVMNNRNGLSVGGELAMAGIALQPALTDLAGYERLIGTADFDLKFLGVGNSLHAIMNSLSGDGSFQIGQGELRGLDLVGMLRNLDLAYEGEGQKTIFDAVGASFTIANGVLRNDDLAFDAPLITATGEGTIGIGTQTFDYRVVPTALKAEDGSGGVTVPVLITGTWADPKFRPDLQSLIDQELEAEREALEERLREEAEAAEEALRDRVNEALGVDEEGGETPEEALERKVEEEAERALRRLLGIEEEPAAPETQN